MIVRSLSDVADTDRVVTAETWTSRRLLLRDDKLGFSLHDTIVHAGTSTEMQYKNHVEAVYCIEGTGSITALETGEVFQISPGTVYALDAHDQHVLIAETDLRLVCVFNPALVGHESHDGDGSYPLPADAAAAAAS